MNATLKETIRTLVGEAKTDQAIAALTDYARTQHHEELLDDLVLLQSRWTQLQKERAALSEQEQRIRLEQIHSELLRLLRTPPPVAPPVAPVGVPPTPVPAPAPDRFGLITIAGGTFTMGCTSEQGGDCYDSEKPTRQITLSDFALGATPVTQAQWRAVMGSDPPKLAFPGCDQCPVERVSWEDVQEFLKRLNAQTRGGYRLPTEAEWEYAARGGQQSRGYKYAGSNDLDEVGWYAENSGGKTQPVGRKKPNELGLYDLSGNVWEWCADWYGPYAPAARYNPQGPSTGSYRVARGGGWSGAARYCRVAYRSYSSPGNRYSGLGFRLAR